MVIEKEDYDLILATYASDKENKYDIEYDNKEKTEDELIKD